MSLLEMIKGTDEPSEETGTPVAAVESPKDEPTFTGHLQLVMILRDREKADAEPVQEEISTIEAKIVTEQAIVDAYQNYDVAEAAKQPDWDRSAAATMAANAEISSHIIAGLEADLYDARMRLNDSHKEYMRLHSMLNTHAEQMDTTRKSVLIEYLKGNGTLQLDRSHARRWLNVFSAARTWCESNFDDEHQPAIDYFIEQLSDYKLPPPTEALFNHLTARDQETYQQFKPTQGAQ